MYLIKRANGIFYIEFEDNNSGIKRRISTRTSSKKEALKYLSTFEQNKKHIVKTEVILLQGFFNEYLKFITTTKSKKYAQSVDLAFRHLINYLGNVVLRKITVRQLERFLTGKYSTTKYGAQLFYKTIRAGFNKAIEWNYLEENPLDGFKLPRMQKNLPAFINEKELELIILNTPNKKYSEIFLFAFYTGMRLSEIVNLKWGAIDLQNRQIIVKNSKSFQTKSMGERMIPIHRKIITLLHEKRGSKEIDDFLFSKCRGVHFHPETVSRNFRKVVRKLKMNPKLHFHSLRHSFASCLVQKGVPIIVLKELLGHHDISVTQIYTHVKNSTLHDALDLL